MAVLGVLISLAVTFGAAPTVLGYSPSGAAAFADQWAIAGSTPWCSGRLCFTASGNDCANFVSYALHDGGGYAFTGYPMGSLTWDGNWYLYHNSYWVYTHSWSVAADLYQHQILHSPGGYLLGTAPGSSVNSYDGLSTGDLVFYDWQTNGSIDHVAIQVGYGYDLAYGWLGNYVDAHTNNRKHAFWSLRPYNSLWATTTVYLVPISAAN